MAEARWIAYELHDGLMQWVIGARMHLAALVASLPQATLISANPPDEVPVKLKEILSYLNQASEEGRQLIRFIESLPETDSALDIIGTLATTSELLTRKTREGRPIIRFQPPEQSWAQLQTPTAWSIVRIVQQALVNAVRHSDADQVAVILGMASETELSVSVIDDGKGFDPCGEFPGHYGLQSMRQRAREARMQLAIDSQPQGGGTRVTLLVPIPPDGR